MTHVDIIKAIALAPEDAAFVAKYYPDRYETILRYATKDRSYYDTGETKLYWFGPDDYKGMTNIHVDVSEPYVFRDVFCYVYISHSFSEMVRGRITLVREP